MKFVNYLGYTDDQHKLASHAPDHKQYVNSLLEAGQLVFGGRFSDGTGGMLVYEAATLQEAEALRDRDPFALNGVFIRSEIKPWLLLAFNPALAKPD